MKNGYSGIEIFLEYEKNEHLNFKYPGWTFLRVYLQSYLFRDNYTNLFVNKKKKYRKKNRMQKIKVIHNKMKYILYLIISLFVYPFRPRTNEVFLFLPFNRKEKGYYPCKFTYNSYKWYNEKSIVLYHNINCNISTIIKSKNSIRLYQYLIRKKLFRKQCIEDLAKKEIDIVLQYVEKIIKKSGKLNTKENERFLQFCRKKLYSFYMLKEKYNDIHIALIKCNITKVFEVASTYPLHMIVNYFTFNTSITTIELQHGLIASDIGPHVYKEKIIKCYPKYLFTFGRKWSTGIRYPIKRENVISTGLSFYNEKRKEKKTNISHQKYILCISDLNINEEMNSVINSILNSYNGNYKVILKLHPLEGSVGDRVYGDLDRTKVEIIKNDDIYSLFSNSSIIIGGTSTALYEGYGFGLPIIIINKEDYTKGYLNNLIDRPNVYLSNNNNDVIKLIEIIENTVILHKNITTDLWDSKDELEVKSCINQIK